MNAKCEKMLWCSRKNTAWLRFLVITLAALFMAVSGHAEDVTNVMQRLTGMSIDELLDQPVTTVAKKPEQLSKSPAAISVLTQQDIQESGARSIPEALRLVPGLDVAQVDSQQWAVSARGFNDIFADKLLVLQDGRSLYTPLFSGVFWDVQNPLLEDIDRIEVIRGPGASLWGANAVNGVISIITKPASQTQGFFGEAGGGTYEQDFFAARYGDKLAEDLYFRVDGQYFDRGDTILAGTDNNAHDSWRMGQGSFRMDWDKTKTGGDLLTLQGEFYEGRLNQVADTFSFPPPTMTPTVYVEDVSGANILGRWSHSFAESNDLTFQTYFDHTDRETVIFGEHLDTFDLDLQHHISLDACLPNDIVWGIGYRLNMDHVVNTPTISFTDTTPQTELFSGFVQDEITFVPDRLRLTLGTRLEHNTYTKFDVQPDARLLWIPVEHHTFWGAVSHAVRTPSEAENFIRLNQTLAPGVLAPVAVPVTLYGNQNFQSEDELAFQLGYRTEVCSNLTFDAATFYNDYNHIRSEALGPSPTQPLILPPPFLGGPVPAHFENDLHGYTYGVELAPTWQVLPWWRLRASYSFLETTMFGPDAISINADVGQSPEQQASLRSSMDLPQNLSLDATVRYVDRLPALAIPSYVVFDVRLAWHPSPKWEFSIVGQNLGSAHHAEFAPTFLGTQRTEIPAGVYAKVAVRF